MNRYRDGNQTFQRMAWMSESLLPYLGGYIRHELSYQNRYLGIGFDKCYGAEAIINGWMDLGSRSDG